MIIPQSHVAVNPGRGYDASRRRRRAEEQRQATLEVARSRFVANGYVATTVAAIASDAGVSEATIYKTYGGKTGLIRLLCERSLAGEGTIPAEERSDSLRSDPDPRHVLAGWASLAREVAPRVAPLLMLLGEAARHDGEAAALLREIERDRVRRMTDNARFLHGAGHLRPGVSVREAADVLWAVSSPELYDALVQRRGWTTGRYAQFLASTMQASLL